MTKRYEVCSDIGRRAILSGQAPEDVAESLEAGNLTSVRGLPFVSRRNEDVRSAWEGVPARLKPEHELKH
jgi:hypothetical protein